jgi:hypothetical protein
MKMNTNNHHNAVFSSTLPVLIVLLVIILAFTGKLNAGKSPADVEIESVRELQGMDEGCQHTPGDSVTGHYDKYYRTLISDPRDGSEKLVELRYSVDGELTEVLVDEKVLTRAERRENEKIITRAMAEEKSVEKEIDRLMKDFGRTMDETLGVVSDVFASFFEEKPDMSGGEADSPGEESRSESRKRDRKARITTLEELESDPRK